MPPLCEVLGLNPETIKIKLNKEPTIVCRTLMIFMGSRNVMSILSFKNSI